MKAVVATPASGPTLSASRSATVDEPGTHSYCQEAQHDFSTTVDLVHLESYEPEEPFPPHPMLSGCHQSWHGNWHRRHQALDILLLCQAFSFRFPQQLWHAGIL